MADLHDRLMGQIDLLCDEELEGEELDRAVKRATAVTSVAKTMIDNAKLVLRCRALPARAQADDGRAARASAHADRPANGDG